MTTTNTAPRFRDYPLDQIAEWLDGLPGRRPPARRAWKKFTDWAYDTRGEFSELSGAGGFSGCPKLLAACHVVMELRERGESLPATVGEALDLARQREMPFGWLPPIEHADRIARLAGRPDLFNTPLLKG